MSISEIILILLIAVLVFKPENLPKIARKLGRWRSYLSSPRNRGFIGMDPQFREDDKEKERNFREK